MCMHREMLSVSPPSRQMMIWSSKLKPWQILLECIGNDLVYSFMVEVLSGNRKALEISSFSKAFLFHNIFCLCADQVDNWMSTLVTLPYVQPSILGGSFLES